MITITKENSLVITRVFDAPREMVWKAWTDAENVKHWWGPTGFTAPSCSIDLRIGGQWLFCMRSPEGQDYWATGTYKEIVDGEKLVFTDCFADEAGHVVPATHYGMPDNIPLEMLVTVKFEDYDGKTRMTVQHDGLPIGNMTEGAGQGWNTSFDKLAESLH